jgi:hypothetical protein
MSGSSSITHLLKIGSSDYPQGNGNVLAVGGTTDGLCVLTRFNESGEQDLAFGSSGGSSLTGLGSFSTNPGGMAIQEDGRILVVGTAVNANNDLFVARFNGEPVGIGAHRRRTIELYPNPAEGRPILLCLPGARTLTVLDAQGWSVVQQDVRGMASTSVEVAWPAFTGGGPFGTGPVIRPIGGALIGPCDLLSDIDTAPPWPGSTGRGISLCPTSSISRTAW